MGGDFASGFYYCKLYNLAKTVFGGQSIPCISSNCYIAVPLGSTPQSTEYRAYTQT